MLPEVIFIAFSILCTAKAQFVIVRGERDVFRNLSSCSDAPGDYCYNSHAEASPIDRCICRCKPLYPLYRNPDIVPVVGGKFESRGMPGCVWHAYHRDECFHIRKYKSKGATDVGVLQFNFAKPGNVTAYTDYDMEGCTELETFVKFPEDSDFKPANGLLSATHLTPNSIRIQWKKADTKYNGVIIRGIFKNCATNMPESDRCFVSKISGVYNDNCTVRAVTGDCCIFPFTYKGKIYHSCTSVDSGEPWCAVRLRFHNETNWQAKCADLPRNTTTPSPVSSISQTPSLSESISTVQTSQWSASISSTEVPSDVSESTLLKATDSSVVFRSMSQNLSLSESIFPVSTPQWSASISSTKVALDGSKSTLTKTTVSTVVFGRVTHTLSLSDIIYTAPSSEWSASISSTEVPFDVSVSTRLNTTGSVVLRSVSQTPSLSESISTVPAAKWSASTPSAKVPFDVSVSTRLKTRLQTPSLSESISTVPASEWSSSISSTKVLFDVSVSTRLNTTGSVVRSVSQTPSLSESISTSPAAKWSASTPSAEVPFDVSVSTWSLNTTGSVVLRSGSQTPSLSESNSTSPASEWSASISSTKVLFDVSVSSRLKTPGSVVVLRSVSQNLSLSESISTFPASKRSASISLTKVPFNVSVSTRLKTTGSVVVLRSVSQTPSLFESISTLPASDWSSSISLTNSTTHVLQSIPSSSFLSEPLFSLTDNSTSVETIASTPLSSVKIHPTPISTAKSHEIPSRTFTPIDVYQAMNSTRQPKPSSTDQTMSRPTVILPRTTPSQEKGDLEDRLVVVFAIAGSVFLVILLIFLLICVCFCARRRQAKNEFHSAMGLIGPSTSPSKEYTAGQPTEEKYALNIDDHDDHADVAETEFTTSEEHPDQMESHPTLLTFKL